MPPKEKYTAAVVQSAALELVRERGIDELTSRTLAISLGCSTAPVFRAFQSMESLHDAVLSAIVQEFSERLEVSVTPDPIVSAGIAWLRYAHEEPRLYEAAFLRSSSRGHTWLAVRARWSERMATVSKYSALTQAQRNGLIGRAAIVMHGLALELWSGRMRRSDFETLVREFVLPVVDNACSRGAYDDPHLRTNG